MSELLLQTIIEKLESLEIALLKENNAAKDEVTAQPLLKEVKSLQSEIAKLPFQFKVSDEKMSKLLETITALNLPLENPVQTKVKHNHHLHKGLWVAVGLFLISLLLLLGWINAGNTKEEFKANDIKYRYIKINGNSHLLKLLYHTDNLFNANAEVFRKSTIQEEDHITEN